MSSNGLGGDDDLVLRSIVEAEQDAIAEIYCQAWHESHAPFIPRAVVEHRGLSFFQKRVAGYGTRPVGAAKDDRILGFVLWSDARLEQLWIRGEVRGQGIGGRLLLHAEAEMAAAGATLLELDCMTRNSGARRFYERHGWRIVSAHSKALGTATGEIGVPVWRMEKALARGDG